MRILGIDPGDRRVGLAMSDELGITAQGLPTFDKKGGPDLFEHVGRLIEAHGIAEIVVGHPVAMSGRRSESSRKAAALAEELQKRFDVRVTLWDERFSTEEARRILRGSKADKGVVDRLAATIILQSYLDYRRRDA